MNSKENFLLSSRPIFQEANALVSAVSDLSGMEPHEIWKDRQDPQFRGRAIVMWILYHNKNYSMPQIGSVFSRDHTSVLNAIRRVNDWRLNNINFVKMCEVIEEKAYDYLPNNTNSVFAQRMRQSGDEELSGMR
jgi:hypothetical protein